MANVRKFDEEEVLGRILEVFWRKGYEATSLDDLVEATKVKRQSLYNAFGNKDEMFRRAYEHYLADVDAVSLDTLDLEAPLAENLHRMFNGFKRTMADPSRPSGCFITNSAVEFGARDDSPMQSVLEQRYQMLEAFFTRLFKKAKARGEIDPQRDPRKLARFVVGAITSAAVLYRVTHSKAFVDSILEETLRAILPEAESSGAAYVRM